MALIGAGSLANLVHYPSLASFLDIRIVGLCDLDEKRLQATAPRFEITDIYRDYRQMLNKTKPDAVYALMPPHQVFDVAMDVLEAGHALFIEKPPTVTTDQARYLAMRAKENKVISAVAFQRRCHPMAQRCSHHMIDRVSMHQVQASVYKNMAPR